MINVGILMFGRKGQFVGHDIVKSAVEILNRRLYKESVFVVLARADQHELYPEDLTEMAAEVDVVFLQIRGCSLQWLARDVAKVCLDRGVSLATFSPCEEKAHRFTMDTSPEELAEWLLPDLRNRAIMRRSRD